jgi:uncharacterized membrane protein
MNTVIQNLLNGDHLEQWSITISYIAFFLGLLFVIIGVCKSIQDQRWAGSQRGKITGATLSIFAGIFLLSFRAFTESLTETIFNLTSSGDFTYNAAGAVVITDQFTAAANAGPEAIYIEFAVYLIQIIGLLSILRGVSLYRTAHENSQNAAGGTWHLIGGTIALNFPTFMDVVGASAGPDVQAVVDRLFG